MNTRNVDLGGAVIFWRLNPYTDRAALAEGLRGTIAETITPDRRKALAVLRGAIADVAGGPTMLLRPLKASKGWTLVEEARGRADNAYSTQFSAFVDVDTEALRLEMFNFPQTEGQLREKLFDVYTATREQVTATAVADLLQLTLGSLLGATTLRPAGGVYWLPERRLAEFQAVARAVEAAAIAQHAEQSAVYIIRHELDADALRAVRDAIVAEVTTDAAAITREVEAGDLGERALTTQRTAAEALRRKVEHYETILNASLEGLQERVTIAEHATARAALLLSTANAPAASIGDRGGVNYGFKF